jgi:SAM-dependent methyltransferase
MVLFSDNLIDFIFSPWSVYVLYTANRLKIFTLLAKEEMTIDEISSRTNTVPRYLEGLLNACVSIGLLQRKNDRYLNSHVSDAHLVEGRPLYLGDIIEVLSIEAGNWENLYNLVTSGSTSNLDDPRRGITPHLFTMAMNNLGMQGEAEALANAVDLSGCKTMIDVGCGSGIYSLSICRHNPNLHAVLLDNKEVLITTNQLVMKSGLQNRISTRAIDIAKDSFGSNIDVALLSDVLYPDSSTCMQILRSVYNALAPKGILIIRGYYADTECSPSAFGSLFSLGQLLCDQKRELITVNLLQNWLKDVGFKVKKAFALTERSTCLIAMK